MTSRRKSTLTNPPGLAPGGSFIELGHIVFGRTIQAGVDNLLHRLALVECQQGEAILTLASAFPLFAHLCQEDPDLPAAARDERPDLGALCQGHADAVNSNVLDLVDAVSDPEPPIHGDRRTL
jgi:hypothetical protein